MGRYRIVLADDHVLLRTGLKSILEKTADLEIIGEAGCGLELLALLNKITPDMVILDISLPMLRGIEATREIKAIYPNVKVLILTMHKNKEYVHQAISAGAEGYLLKEDADTELISAIETIRRGRTYVSPLLSGELTADWAQIYRGKSKIPFEGGPLTTREKEVLKLIAAGKSNKEIAELIHISARTVEHHRANIMNKLNMRKTAELVK
jgi:DNA-binding NarL/FixJ family response regulator